MLLLPVIIQALAFLPILRVGDPILPVQDTGEYNGGNDTAISRYGCSPLYEISAAYTGFTPSFDLSTVRMGSTPLVDLFTCHFNRPVLNESGECVDILQPLLLAPVILFPSKFAFSVNLFYQCVTLLVGHCAVFLSDLFCQLRALFFGVLRTLVWLGLCAFFIVDCPALMSLSVFLFFIAIVSEISFAILAIVLFNCFCGCLFVGHVGCRFFFKVGYWAFAFLAIISCLCGSFLPLLAGPCAFVYYVYYDNATGYNPANSFFTEQVSSAMVSFGNSIEAIIRTIWEPFFTFVLYLLLLFPRLFIPFLFFFGLRHFFSSPSPTFF